MISIDFANINEEAVYEAFHIDGNESETLNDSYLELFELVGRDAMLKVFKYFRGDRLSYEIVPSRVYSRSGKADNRQA